MCEFYIGGPAKTGDERCKRCECTWAQHYPKALHLLQRKPVSR
jgi:hypothetical protein